jgi:hypothetical protein
MFRKLALALIAVATVAAVTPASARGFHGGGRGFHGGGHHFHGGGRHFGGRHFGHHRFARGYYGRGYGGYYAGGYGAYYGSVAYSCYRIVDTDVGPRPVNVCD